MTLHFPRKLKAERLGPASGDDVRKAFSIAKLIASTEHRAGFALCDQRVMSFAAAVDDHPAWAVEMAVLEILAQAPTLAPSAAELRQLAFMNLVGELGRAPEAQFQGHRAPALASSRLLPEFQEKQVAA